VFHRIHAPHARLAIRRAYTLIEVLVVVTVLGIAASMVIPSFGGSDGMRVQAAVRTIVSDIAFAQSDALAFQSGRAVIFHLDEGRYSVVEVRGGTVDEDTDLIQGQKLSNARFGALRIVSVDFGSTISNALIFDEMGAPVTSPGGSTPAGNGTIIIEGAGDRYTLTVEGYTGRITVARADIVAVTPE
jgi:prepilin-type N-terminal cleavage/methylation domain-containing protein